jgi:hypothetical protein
MPSRFDSQIRPASHAYFWLAGKCRVKIDPTPTLLVPVMAPPVTLLLDNLSHQD